jgi:hypothetical protein
MRNSLAFLAAAAIVLAGAGWYLDWFQLSSNPNGDGHRQVTIDVNTNKVGTDVTTAVKKADQMIEKDKATDPKADIKGGIEVQGIEVKPKIDVTLP